MNEAGAVLGKTQTQFICVRRANHYRTSSPLDASLASRIIRRVRVAEDVDGIARVQRAALEGGIGVEREIEDRERADCIECPSRDALHALHREVHEAVLGGGGGKG